MEQSTADAYSSAAVPSADAAASTLRDVEAAQTRARLQARNAPAWFGPVYAAVIAVFFFAGRAAADAHSPWVLVPTVLMLLAALTLVRARRRSTGVKLYETTVFGSAPGTRRITAVALLLIAGGAGALCWNLASGTLTTNLVGAAAVFVALCALSAWRNIVVRRQLQARV
ncbi:hypothetical protein [Streptomyces sp. NBC_00859]|uniref:hypothetical protein n=1 Tax=Streptomyces sp. NBC_00859 TaxID=2903682 RepID=UPI0038674B9A|nr:hypothetical protein OG584_20350 [Streptomyces sp. NBC_00859]